ncbi:MAG: hypothetical protein Q9226_004578 [Calogaya cf. arnoldii]
MIVLMIFGCFVYLVATEYISAKKSKGEVLFFRRGRVPDLRPKLDQEANGDRRVNQKTLAGEKIVLDAPASIQKQTKVLHWESVNYDIKNKGGPRRLLDDVDGWVIPGTLTALMGVTGAGKTTLLDVLANRITLGVVSGQILIDGRLRDTGFQRKTGYVQQQDLHLATSTVREALLFSAVLRQPEAISHAEKFAYVNEVITVLEMEAYADAVIGVPGEGLDSQTAWSICALLRKLVNNGQAILCTIHQPSAILFQEFDRVLLLAKGGKTLYFGDLGDSAKTLTNYFERNGARPCGRNENPAEWMLQVTNAASTQDWSAIWNNSKEREGVKAELARLKEHFSHRPAAVNNDTDVLRPFAASFSTQLQVVLVRVFQQYWRTPSYLYSKVALCLSSVISNPPKDITRHMANAQTGIVHRLFLLENAELASGSAKSNIMPHFVTQRALYEIRERPSKTYCWQVFMLSNILVEIPWNSLMAVFVFVGWYYPISLRQNAMEADQVAERGALMFLFILTFLIFAGTFTHMVIAGIESAETAGNITNLLFSLSLIFCGVLATPSALPKFWIFMYCVSPFTYLVSGMLSVGLANARITCSAEELLRFRPRPPLNCSAYLGPYIASFGGYLTPESVNSTIECVFCAGSDTNVFLRGVSAEYGDRWRNLGVFVVYAVFNVGAAVGFYWLARVPKGKRQMK